MVGMVAEKHGEASLCPFCREVATIGDDEEPVRRLRKRMETNDPDAFMELGRTYHRGLYGLPQDSKKAFELWSKAAELGYILGYGQLGSVYCFGLGVEKDIKKAIHYYQLAAVGGDMVTRRTLGALELNEGRVHRAMKHYMIAARAGCNDSLEHVKEGYKDGHVAKDDFANTLRAHKTSVDGRKSDRRDQAAGMSADRN